MDAVRPARKRPQHPQNLGAVPRLAKHGAVAVHHGIAPKHQRAGALGGHGAGLGLGQAARQRGGGGRGDGALVHLADAQGEIRRQQGEQLPAAGAGGGQDQCWNSHVGTSFPKV